MEARTSWNDDRLDHLSGQVDSLRSQVDSLRHHMDERFEKQDARIDARFDKLDGHIHRLYYLMIITLGSLLTAFGGALFAVRF